jgi:hypothetical protein
VLQQVGGGLGGKSIGHRLSVPFRKFAFELPRSLRSRGSDVEVAQQGKRAARLPQEDRRDGWPRMHARRSRFAYPRNGRLRRRRSAPGRMLE